MNLKAIAKALGVQFADDADDATIRAAVAEKLGIDKASDDATILAKLAGRSAPPPPAPAAAAEPPRERVIETMFAHARRIRPNDATLAAMEGCALINTVRPVDEIRDELLAHLGASQDGPIGGHYTPSVQTGEDARAKLRTAASDWLLVRAAVVGRDAPEARGLGSNPFRGMSTADMARMCLEEAGVSTRRMNRNDIIVAAITHSTSDFPNIFENALHKTLLVGYRVVPTTYDKVCKVGSLSDFRPHIRYRGSSLGDLQVRLENGEYKTLTLSDAERETITAKARGGILNISREMLVNDDMGFFTDVVMMLGKSAARTREKALYTALAENAGMGPTLGDGKALFHTDHGNISTSAGAPTVVSVDADRVKMASQRDPGSNDFVDIRPSIWLGPLSLGSTVRTLNDAQYDPDTANKLQKPNAVRGLYDQVLDTPRLSGTPWYSFADPNLEPVFEIGFVDGQQEPQLAMEESFTQHGMKWRVVDEWGLNAIGFRGAVRNAGQ